MIEFLVYVLVFSALVLGITLALTTIMLCLCVIDGGIRDLRRDRC